MKEEQGFKHLEQTKDEEFAERVLNKYEPKDMINTLRIKTNNCRSLSYPFQFISLLSLMAFINWFTDNYQGVVYYLLIIFLTVIAIGWEIGKRFSIIESFDGAWNPSRKWKMIFFIPAILLCAGSFAGSFKGGDEMTKKHMIDPELIADARIDSLKAAGLATEGLVKTLENTKWKGTTTRTANKGINIATELQLERQKSLNRIEAKEDQENAKIINKAEAKKASLGLVLGLISGMMDILILILLGFAEKFETQADKILRAGSSPPLSSSIDSFSGKLYKSPPSSGAQNRTKIGFAIPEKGFVSPTHTEPPKQAKSLVRQQKQTYTNKQTEPKQRPKPAEYVTKMKSRVRVRWARSYAGQPGAPKSEASRKIQRDLAREEWQELEEMGYKIEMLDKSMPWRLTFTPPNR